MPYDFSLCKSFGWQTVSSKAREKSIYATWLANLFSNEIVQSLIDSKRFVNVRKQAINDKLQSS